MIAKASTSAGLVANGIIQRCTRIRALSKKRRPLNSKSRRFLQLQPQLKLTRFFEAAIAFFWLRHAFE